MVHLPTVRRACSFAIVALVAACAAAPASEDLATDRSDLSRGGGGASGTIIVHPMPPMGPINTTPPENFVLSGVSVDSDGATRLYPGKMYSSNTVGLQWLNSDTSQFGFSTIWRQVTNVGDTCGTSCTWVPIATLCGLPAGYATWIDPNAAPNAQNCYVVVDTDVNGATAGSPQQCAFTHDTSNVHPVRVQLGMTVGSSYENMTLAPVFVRLQDGVSIPSGNISWVAKDDAYLLYGQTTSFDLTSYKSIEDLTDITQITIGVAGSDDLCIKNMTLLIDYDGAPDSPYKVAFFKDYSSRPGGCATAVGSDYTGNNGTQIQVGFQELRQSPDWSYQIATHVANSQNHALNFDGFFDGNATRGFIMGLAQNAIQQKGIQMRVDHPIELTVHGNDVRPNNILTVKAHVYKDCDAYAQVDIRLVNTCDCVNGTNVIVATGVELENASAGVEPWSLCSIGVDALGDITELLTRGNWSFADWLEDDLNGKVQAAIAGKSDSTLPIAPPFPTQFEFHSQDLTRGGFGVASGQTCDTFNNACSCAGMDDAGHCTPH